MNNLERRDQQILYISDDAVFEEQKKCRNILQKLNFMDRADFAGISALVKELFGTSDGAFLNPPFYCDYGSHIHVGKNFFANYNCTASPSGRGYTTINDNPDAITFSWEADSTPVAVSGHKATCEITIDSTKANETKLGNLVDLLYGTSNSSSQLPTPDTVLSTMHVGA